MVLHYWFDGVITLYNKIGSNRTNSPSHILHSAIRLISTRTFLLPHKMDMFKFSSLYKTLSTTLPSPDISHNLDSLLEIVITL